MKKKIRGKFLTAILVLSIIGILQALFNIATKDSSAWSSEYRYIPQWLKTYQLLGVVIAGLANIGLWFWKKWSVYLLIILSIINYFINIYILQFHYPVIYLLGFILFMIPLWAIKRKWEYFG